MRDYLLSKKEAEEILKDLGASKKIMDKIFYKVFELEGFGRKRYVQKLSLREIRNMIEKKRKGEKKSP